MSLTTNLKEYLLKQGATEVGFANLSDMNLKFNNITMNSGISILTKLNPKIIQSIENGPTEEYFNEYNRINDKLDEITLAGEKFLKKEGYNAYALTKDRVKLNNKSQSTIPYKTVATKAGLGWIGKSALFVSKKYGSAVRLSTILTDAKLDYATPITLSQCGLCNICKDLCPGKAISGKSWDINLNRSDIFNYELCMNKARELSKQKINKDITLCGKCIIACPYTQKYLKNLKK